MSGAETALLPRLQQSHHLAWVREPPNLMLGKDEIALDHHIKDAAAALEHARVGPQRHLKLGDQPGRVRLVVSHPAVFDGDIHDPFMTRAWPFAIRSTL